MSDHHPHASTPINSTLVSFIFIATFIICVLILAKMNEVSHPQTVEAAAEVAQVEMTSTPAPTQPTAPTAAPTAIPTSIPPTAEVALAPTPASSNAAAPQTAAYDPALVAKGQELFLTCSACHGPDAHGLPNLGKDLIASEFVGGLTDDEFVTFITTGRPSWDPLNTTGIDMPPKGGNPAITTEDLQAIVAYIRTLRAQAGTTAAPAAAPAASQTTAYDPALVAQGQEGFMLCSACHGPDAHGLPNLGKDLVTSEFAKGLTDQELLEFVKKGRPMWDPLNTTGIDMPPKGGNPALTDDQILAIIAYIRTLEAANKS